MDRERSMSPQINDLVIDMSQGPQPDMEMIGILKEIRETEDGKEYIVQGINGVKQTWRNTEPATIKQGFGEDDE